MRVIRRLILLDTSVLANDFWMRGVSFRALRDLLAVFEAQVVLPDLVVAEATWKLRELIGSTLQKASRLDHLLNQEVIALISTESVMGSYEEFLRELFRPFAHTDSSSPLFTFADYPEISHAEVVGRLLEGRRPFRGGPVKEKGYRDFLIWQSVVETVRESPDSLVYFVSENTTDFAADKNSLHDHLLADLPLGRCVEFHSSLASLIEHLLASLGSEVRSFLTKNPELIEHLRSHLVPPLINRWLSAVAAPRRGDGRTYMTITADDIDVELRQVTPLSNGTILLLVQAVYPPGWTYPGDSELVLQNSEDLIVTLEVNNDLEVVSADVEGDPLDLPPNSGLKRMPEGTA